MDLQNTENQNEFDNEQQSEFGNDIITLVDDEGKEFEFEVVDSVEVNSVNYLALVPVYDNPDNLLEDTGELVILKVLEEDGEEVLEAVEDEAEFKEIGEIFMERLEDVFDFEDEE